MKQTLVALVLSLAMICTACNTTWVTTVDTILSVAGPALVNILQIVSVAEGKPLDKSLTDKVTTDIANIETLSRDFATASSLAAPGVCTQLEAAINTYAQDQTAVFNLMHVTNQNTQVKLNLLATLVSGTVNSIVAVVPKCNNKAQLREFANTVPPVDANAFVTSYNSILTTKVGDAKVDDFTAKHKLHKNPKTDKFVHFVTFGMVN